MPNRRKMRRHRKLPIRLPRNERGIMPAANTLKSVLQKMVPDPMTGCWLWTGHVNKKGYGSVSYKGRQWQAHRLIYTLLKGPIPEGMVLMHSCDTPACINPSHLQPGTDKENAWDRERKHRRKVPKGEKNWSAGVTDKQADEVRELRKAGYQLESIVKTTGVHYSTVRRILYCQGRFAGHNRTYLNNSKHAVGV